jgi:flagellar basal-body rod modification protein FlgD
VLNPDPNNPIVTDPSKDSGQDFMRLIIEQLKNQDPMNPLNSGEFTTQLAQINSLEQLINMNTLMEQFIGGGKLADATALIGRYVEGMDANGTSIAGTVESVEVIDGVPSLKIGDQLLLPSQVVTVSDKAKG